MPTIGLAITIAALFALLVIADEGSIRKGPVLAGLTAVFLGSTAVEQYESPEPLPRIAISTKELGVVQGLSVTHGEGIWYVATKGGQLRAVADSDAEWVRIDVPDTKPDERGVGEKLFGIDL